MHCLHFTVLVFKLWLLTLLLLTSQGIYGCAKPGQLQGLMGPSGAGKSTLMDLLAMRTPHDAEAPAAEEPEMTNPSVAPRAVVPLRPLHRSDQSTDSEDSAVATAGLSTVDEDGSNVGGVGNSSLREPPPQLLANGIRMKQRAYMNISAYVPQVRERLLTLCLKHHVCSNALLWS